MHINHLPSILFKLKWEKVEIDNNFSYWNQNVQLDCGTYFHYTQRCQLQNPKCFQWRFFSYPKLMEIEIIVSYHSASKPSIKAKLDFIADSVWAVPAGISPTNKVYWPSTQQWKGYFQLTRPQPSHPRPNWTNSNARSSPRHQIVPLPKSNSSWYKSTSQPSIAPQLTLSWDGSTQ